MCVRDVRGPGVRYRRVVGLVRVRVRVRVRVPGGRVVRRGGRAPGRRRRAREAARPRAAREARAARVPALRLREVRVPPRGARRRSGRRSSLRVLSVVYAYHLYFTHRAPLRRCDKQSAYYPVGVYKLSIFLTYDSILT